MVCLTYTYVEKSPSIKVHRVTDPFFKSKFNFSQTVGEMDFVSFEVEKIRMFLVQLVVRWYCVLVRSRGAVVSFPVVVVVELMLNVLRCHLTY